VFEAFAALLPNGAADLFLFHPSDLVALLEYAWDHRANQAFATGDPRHRSDLPGMGGTWMGQFFNSPPTGPIQSNGLLALIGAMGPASARGGGLMWEHLIYAYMIENTRVYEVFRRVINELVHGEKLGPAHQATQNWLRSTEQLFYTDPPPFFVTSLISHVRPSMDAVRCNAYYRMFGMDLNHKQEGMPGVPCVKADASNHDFVATMEEFIREVWVGIININNSSGAKPTDDAKIANLATRLHDMLMSRRVYGTLSREEFVIVAMMSWFHLSLSDNLPIVTDLRAEAASPEERLFKIAQNVGLPAHGLSKSFFELAKPISHILILIETGVLNNVAAVPVLYTPGPVEQSMRLIATHWSVIRGVDVRAGKVAT
jgi:hypothetical protein